MQEYCFGIDVGGTTVKMGLFRTDGELLEKWEIPSHTENEGAAILPDIAKAALGKLEERGIDKKDVAGIGIGVPGPIDANGVVPHTANLGWGYKEVTKELTELTGLPSKGGNDANVAALGEMWKGAAAGHKSGVMVTLGTGVGGGVIINGKIITGAHGAGGEIGHIHVDDEVPGACGCGNHGCLEHVASANGIVRLAKWMLEQILTDIQKADPEWNVILLRYFNPIGAHKSGMIGEDPKGIPNNLLPYVAQVAIGKLECLGVFGNDYDTPDGTGVRDYIHVVDLAVGHVKAVERLADNEGVSIYNLGTGNGYSVLQVVHAFEKACGHPIKYQIKPRRAGDIAMCYCDPTKAKEELGWEAQYGIEEMCQDSWRWQSQNPDGYATEEK